MHDPTALMLGLGAPFYRDAEGRLYVETQTGSGVHAWCKHFEKVIAFSVLRGGVVPDGWRLMSDLDLDVDHIELPVLPDT